MRTPTTSELQPLFDAADREVSKARLDFSTNDLAIVAIMREEKTRLQIYRRRDLLEIWAEKPSLVARMSKQPPPDYVPFFILIPATDEIVFFEFQLDRKAVVLN